MSRKRSFIGEEVLDTYLPCGCRAIDCCFITIDRNTFFGGEKKFVSDQFPDRRRLAARHSNAYPEADRKILFMLLLIAEKPIFGMTESFDKILVNVDDSEPCKKQDADDNDEPLHKVINVFKTDIKDTEGKIVATRFTFARYSTNFEWRRAIRNYIEWRAVLQKNRRGGGVTNQPKNLEELPVTEKVHKYLFPFETFRDFTDTVSQYAQGFFDDIDFETEWSSPDFLWKRPDVPASKGKRVNNAVEEPAPPPSENAGAHIMRDKCDPTFIFSWDSSVAKLPQDIDPIHTNQEYDLEDASFNEPNVRGNRCSSLPWYVYVMNFYPSQSELEWMNVNPKMVKNCLADKNDLLNTQQSVDPYQALKCKIDEKVKFMNAIEKRNFLSSEEVFEMFDSHYVDDPSQFKKSSEYWIFEQEDHADELYSAEKHKIEQEVNMMHELSDDEKREEILRMNRKISPFKHFSMYFRKIVKFDSTLSNFGNTMCYFLKAIENFFDLKGFHSEYFQIVITFIQLFDHEKYAPGHKIFQGTAAAGKSVMFERIKETMIPGTVEAIDSETERANNVTKNKDFILLICDEAGKSIMDKAFVSAQDKTMLSSGIVETARNEEDEKTGQRVYKKTVANMKNFRMYGSNEATCNMDKAMKSRFSISHVPTFERDVNELGLANEEMRKIGREILESELRKIVAISYQVQAMIAAGILSIDDSVSNRTMEVIVPELKKQMGIDEVSDRQIVMVRRFIKALCVFHAVCRVFSRENPNKKFNMTDFAKLQPHLFVTEEMVIFGISSMKNVFIHDIVEPVATVIKKNVDTNSIDYYFTKDDQGVKKFDYDYYGISVKDAGQNSKIFEASRVIGSKDDKNTDENAILSLMHLLKKQNHLSKDWNVPENTIKTKKGVIKSDPGNVYYIGILRDWVDYHADGIENFKKVLTMAQDKYDYPKRFVLGITMRQDYKNFYPYLYHVMTMKCTDENKVTKMKNKKFITDDKQTRERMLGMSISSEQHRKDAKESSHITFSENYEFSLRKTFLESVGLLDKKYLKKHPRFTDDDEQDSDEFKKSLYPTKIILMEKERSAKMTYDNSNSMEDVEEDEEEDEVQGVESKYFKQIECDDISSTGSIEDEEKDDEDDEYGSSGGDDDDDSDGDDEMYKRHLHVRQNDQPARENKRFKEDIEEDDDDIN